jgi:hypothetical protein
MASKLEDVPGHPEENLAAAYRTSTDVVRQSGGLPQNRPELTQYLSRLRTALSQYRPVGSAAPEPAAS